MTCLHCGRRIAPFTALGLDRWLHVHTGREACGDYVGTWAYPQPVAGTGEKVLATPPQTR